jgi:DNA helicase II / ATP-dependent DNA helicase PcrA
VIHSPDDSAALLRIVNVPNRRLGKQRIDILVKDGQTNSRSLWQSLHALISGEIRFPTKDTVTESCLVSFIASIKTAQQNHASRQLATVSDLINYVRSVLGYDGHLRKKFGPEFDERVGNVEELKTFSTEIEQVTEENKLPDIGVGGSQNQEETPLQRFLGNIALMTDVRDAEDDKYDNVITACYPS